MHVQRFPALQDPMFIFYKTLKVTHSDICLLWQKQYGDNYSVVNNLTKHLRNISFWASILHPYYTFIFQNQYW